MLAIFSILSNCLLLYIVLRSYFCLQSTFSIPDLLEGLKATACKLCFCLKLVVLMLMKSWVFIASTQERSDNPGDVNWMQVICIIWLGILVNLLNYLCNPTLDMSNFPQLNIAVTFRLNYDIWPNISNVKLLPIKAGSLKISIENRDAVSLQRVTSESLDFFSWIYMIQLKITRPHLNFIKWCVIAQ